MSRERAIGDFLAAAGWARATRQPLAGDASARRYHRLTGNGGSAILMDCPPESGLDLAPFLQVTAWLRGSGLSAPEIRAADAGAGLLLLEDLGDALLARLCAADPGLERPLYAAAVDVLARLHRLAPPEGAWTPPSYDATVLVREARLAAEWYLPSAGGPTEAALAEDLGALVARLAEPVLSAPAVPVHRDYHAENLLWLPERTGLARIGLLDYQDMLLGHPAYDLVSLLKDARREVPAELRAAMSARYLDLAGGDPQGFRYAAHYLSAQRNLKILGLFTRLWRRDGKPGYLRHLPRVWAHLREDLAHPDLALLAAWVARHLPAPGNGILARLEAAAS